ncbi:MAG: rubrerythrin family protein [Clostridiales bacterium]|nr:rubrerythrin family protein [Clostridiales bacterium]
MGEIQRMCELRIPYPPPKAEKKNILYASLLTNDYAGIISEMSAVSVYTYQHIATPYGRISEVLRCISAVEMRHMKMLGSLIVSLGGNPRIAVKLGRGYNYWSSQCISYETNPRIYLREDLACERAAITSYKLRITQIDDNAVRKVLERIILDEERHVELLTALCNEFL